MRINTGDSLCIAEVHGGAYMLQIHVSEGEVQAIEAMNPPYTIEITHKRKRRSITANSYLWVLCDEIAKAIRSTKEAVYKKAVREVGVWDAVKVRTDAADKFISSWGLKGIGWFAEKSLEEPGWTEIVVYYGSSIYSTAEMGRLIDWVVDEAQGLGIDTLTPEHKSLLMSEWGEMNENH